jgi:LytTr DNA-binding domain
LSRREYPQASIKTAPPSCFFLPQKLAHLAKASRETLWLDGRVITCVGPIIARMPMKEMLEKLPAQDFIRVHRSYILPLTRIVSLRNNVIITPEKEIPVGKTYLEEIQRLYKP